MRKLRPAVAVRKRNLPTLTLCLLLVVGAPLGILSVLSRTLHSFDESKFGQHTIEAMQTLVAAYPTWREHNADATCPTDLLDLGTDAAVRDQWGRDLRFRCSHDALVVTSAGPDERFGTADDLTQ